MGDVTIHDFLGTHGLLPQPRREVDVVVIPTDADLEEPARQVARSLRAAGVRTSTPLELRKLGKELARADRAGAQVVVIVGREDWDAGRVTVRSMAAKAQQQVGIESASQAVTTLLAEQSGDV
jgi:histidyl-tRNA synthetase